MLLINYLFECNRFAFYGLAFLGIILVRYFSIAGGLHLFFYSTGGDYLARRATPLSPPSGESIRRDIKLSICSAVIFALCAASPTPSSSTAIRSTKVSEMRSASPSSPLDSLPKKLTR